MTTSSDDNNNHHHHNNDKDLRGKIVKEDVNVEVDRQHLPFCFLLLRSLLMFFFLQCVARAT